MKLNHLYFCVCLLMGCYSIINKAQDQLNSLEGCIELQEAEDQIVPVGLRIVTESLDSEHLLLFDPSSGNTSQLGYSSNSEDESSAIPFVYNNNKSLLLIKDSSIQTLDLSVGITGEVVKVDSIFLPKTYLGNNSLLLSGGSWVEYQLLNLTTGQLDEYTYPELIDYISSDIVDASEPKIPIYARFSPSFDQIAYWAFVPVGENRVIRIQRVDNDSYLDFTDEIFGSSETRYFEWKSNRYLGVSEGIFGGEREYIVDTDNQEIVNTILPPSEDWTIVKLVLSSRVSKYAVVFQHLPSENYVVYVTDSDKNDDTCIKLLNKPMEFLNNSCIYCGNAINWTHDTRYIWWLECQLPVEDSTCKAKYNLMIFDTWTNLYSVLMENVSRNTRVVRYWEE